MSVALSLTARTGVGRLGAAQAAAAVSRQAPSLQLDLPQGLQHLLLQQL